MDTLWPAMVAVALRLLVELFAVTVTVTVPDPVPLAGDTLSHPTESDAVQAHPVPVLTDTDAVPAVAATATVAGDTVYVQVLPPFIVNWFDSALRPVPNGPTAATRDSYTPPGRGQPDTPLLKS